MVQSNGKTNLSHVAELGFLQVISESTLLSGCYFFWHINILAYIKFDENDLLLTSSSTARPIIPTYVQKTDPTPAVAKGRWCKLVIVPPLRTPNETSSCFLEDLMALPSTHVHNPARCSIVSRARTPKTRFLISNF